MKVVMEEPRNQEREIDSKQYRKIYAKILDLRAFNADLVNDIYRNLRSERKIWAGAPRIQDLELWLSEIEARKSEEK